MSDDQPAEPVEGEGEPVEGEEEGLEPEDDTLPDHLDPDDEPEKFQGPEGRDEQNIPDDA